MGDFGSDESQAAKGGARENRPPLGVEKSMLISEREMFGHHAPPVGWAGDLRRISSLGTVV